MPEQLAVTHPPVSVSKDFIDYPYFSDLGAVQLAPVLKCAVVDAFALPGSTLEWLEGGRARLGAPVPEVVAAIPDAGLHVVGYTPFHRPPRRDELVGELLAALRARNPEAVILLADAYQSGQHYVDVPGEQVLASYPEADAYVKYEAEVTVPKLVAAWRQTGERPRGVHRGASPEKLDALPLPGWSAIDLPAYFRFQERVVERLGRGPWAFPIGRTLPMVTSRGCPFVCVHCSSNPGRLLGEPKTQRRLSPGRLREHLAALVGEHGAARVEVLDELLNVNEAHFDAFLDEVESLGVLFDVPNGMRADYLEPRHFRKMKGRVSTVSVSAESGVQRVVTEVVKKRLDLTAVVRAAEGAHEAGVPLMVHFIIGLPGETAEEVNGTLAFAADLFDRYGAQPAVQFATPLPGTQLAEGRALPVLGDGDWGPRFQMAPSQPGAEVAPDVLRKFKWTFDQRIRASQGPQKLIMNVTYVCNNHCSFCAVGTRTQIHGHPERQREHLIKYRRLGVRMVDFDGGEPTMNPELVPLVQYSRALGFERVNVTTNGRMCAYEQYARQLVRSGLTTLLFSVHGPDAVTHAHQVGVAEAYEQTLQGIRNCLRFAPPGVELGMNVTITKGNHDKQEALAQLAWDLGLRWLNVQFLTPFGRATRHVAPDTQKAADATARVIDRWGDRMKICIINLPFCFMPGYETYMMGDLAKLERHMVFVNNEDVNLAKYLAERRVRKPVCAGCPHAVFCGGFYELEAVPEPPWIVTTEDWERPVLSD